MENKLFGGAARSSNHSKMSEARSEHFFFGAATSAHQVEGGNHNDWTEWERVNAKLKVKSEKLKVRPDYILNGYPNPLQEENYVSGKAADHYNRFREDFDIAKSLGHNAHRFSIEWSRVEPEEGKFDEKEIEHYAQVIRALRERGLEPFVTLWHWTLPVWLAKKGGLLNKKFPDFFSRFTELIGERFKNDVSFWITLNEPQACAGGSYFKGIWPPGKKNLFLYYWAIARLIQAHRAAYKSLKQIDPSFSVGVVEDMVFFESAGGPINDFLKWLADGVWNFHFIGHVRRSLDFIGFNYYFHNRVNYWFNKNKNAVASDMGWEIYPEGIYHLLKDLKKYGMPIYVTENGVADARDTHRAKFIEDHIGWMKKAMAEGVDVRGYFYWSLLDNFEWDKGFWPRFGLVEVDYKTMERKIRRSAWEYKKIISSAAL